MSKKVEQPENEKLQGQIAELTNDLQRTRADFENFRKQTEAQRTQAMTVAREETVRKVLPLLDNMELAIKAHAELKPLEGTMKKVLEELRLAKIETGEGTEFNPDLHEAVTMEEGEGEHEVVSETLRPGYTYEGRVLRPAMVQVKRA